MVFNLVQETVAPTETVGDLSCSNGMLWFALQPVMVLNLLQETVVSTGTVGGLSHSSRMLWFALQPVMVFNLLQETLWLPLTHSPLERLQFLLEQGMIVNLLWGTLWLWPAHLMMHHLKMEMLLFLLGSAVVLNGVQETLRCSVQPILTCHSSHQSLHFQQKLVVCKLSLKMVLQFSLESFHLLPS